ncbi:transposase [Telmatocola sphagniphila]|uniref:Transposase n=1 Tax=Telmatocola sphagniphila TaxID=1123043 RepID=A0A8E6ETS0_9BACT|nr:transposase [Telmatocola sphagniphila]
MVPNLKKGDRRRAPIVFIDETGLRLAPLLRRTWAPKGLRPYLKQKAGRRQKISIIGALTYLAQLAVSTMRFFLVSGW